MILSNAPQNEAVLSNVGEIGEFRIRNSAKAFSILSSGLYANKIRAIVRELSCNAVDSHAAAGKKDIPFDVHLPNTLEPHFSIRDYGTGLTHDQVTNIYTTYFESTKTASNEFIGALGLGSKSPFSYTDNFTVTAIKDGRKGIYSAFINGDGVPSIALMMEEQTDEPRGVEVKFSVNDRYDFNKFREEARNVYTYFALRPVVSGCAEFEFYNVEYDSKDIVPGVHSYKGSRGSVAVMGNIAYPIQIPEADKTLGDLRQLLNCGLEMHFAIGELDFQASREGLSYIPQTIESIKRKLSGINAALAVVLSKEADAIDNLWDRAVFLHKKKDSALWNAAVTKYATDTKLSTYDTTSWGKLAKFTFEIGQLGKQYNIMIRAIQRSRHNKTISNVKPSNDYSDTKDAKGYYVHTTNWHISVDGESHFVINDSKVGATERVKYHYRETKCEAYSQTVYVLEPVDRAKKMDTNAFFAAIQNPPADRIIVASSLMVKPRKDSGLGKNVTILKLEERGSGGYYKSKEMVWRDAGKSDSFDANTVHYYLPLSGFSVQSAYGMTNPHRFFNDLKDCGIEGLRQAVIYGVRKSDIDFIKTQKNWVNIEDHISQLLSKVDTKLMMSLVLQAVDNFHLMQYNVSIVNDVTNKNSPYLQLVNQFKGFEKVRYNEQSLKNLCRMYAPSTNFSPEAFVQKFVDECATISKRYPLLQYLRSAPNYEVANYVNMIDTQKGVK